ncbi:transcriptional regulator/antitoxin MazE [Cereibacter sp. SYSU M97828]|nr:transcriptional regulator/antitoxin MazE [Cereibacter flavus]
MEGAIKIMQSKILKQGEASVMVLTEEMLDSLGAKAGDTLFVVQADDGSLRVSTEDLEVAAALRAAEAVMDENRDLLAALA